MTTHDTSLARALGGRAAVGRRHEELEGHVAVAIAGQAPPAREARLLVLLGAVLDAGGAPAAAALQATADAFRRADERARAARTAGMTPLGTAAPGALLGAIEREGEQT